MERNLAYGLRANHNWPETIGILRRDRVYLLKETRKLRNKIKRSQKLMISHPAISGIDLWLKELYQELAEIKLELENLCD